MEGSKMQKVIRASVAWKSESTLYYVLKNTSECHRNCQSKYNGSATLKSADSRTTWRHISWNIPVADWHAQNILDWLIKIIENTTTKRSGNVHRVSNSALDSYYLHVTCTLSTKRTPCIKLSIRFILPSRYVHFIHKKASALKLSLRK
jgi:hypothetical protein